jgi:hypothetical protein
MHLYEVSNIYLAASRSLHQLSTEEVQRGVHVLRHRHLLVLKLTIFFVYPVGE